jgi:M6 family metalloprotease-like protein
LEASETAGCDFSQYDNEGDSMAESIFIVHSGEGSETSLDADDIQSHVSTISAMGGTARFYDGVTVDRYACCPELQSSGPASHINIGVYCHEYGHILGLPDLYDVGRWCTSISSWGIGAWGLMSYGGWGGDVVSPHQPSHMCSWSKIQLGWVTPIPVSGWSQMTTLQRFEQYPQVLKIGMNTSESEHFLVEYRDSSYGFDGSLVKQGLLIYHVDDNMVYENDCEKGGTCTSGGFHYMVALEQPDGNFDLDCGTAGNYGDRGDVYPYQAVGEFTAGTTPNSDRYDGGASGASVSGIGFSGPGQMSMFVSSGVLYPEIGYDDGYHNICYQWGVANSGFAVRITPPKYPALVRGLEIMSCDFYNTTFQCRIWDDSGTGGAPGSPLSTLHTVSGALPLAWTYEDFTADSVVISSGDFWAVYIEYSNSQLASDNDSPWSGRTMTYYAGSFSPDGGAYGNYMIRGVVDTVFCAGVEQPVSVKVIADVGPNPFRGSTALTFGLTSKARVKISVYDVGGRLVNRLADRVFPAGTNSVIWTGKDRSGLPVSPGVYFYRLESGKTSHTGKLSLLR